MLAIFDNDDPPALVLAINTLFYAKQTSLAWRPSGASVYMDFRPTNLRL
jgi:hypothetical protein